jgi:hypothetical protein
VSDWQVGDLALCVDDGPCRCGNCPAWPIFGLELGKVYRVLAVRLDNQGLPGLVVDRPPTPPTDPYHMAGSQIADRARFRKIRPDEHEACEPEFVTLLKRTKRKVSA